VVVVVCSAKKFVPILRDCGEGERDEVVQCFHI
jgi:hypothetical protein